MIFQGTLCTKFAVAGLGLKWFQDFRIVSKKWTDQCEDCSLKKKEVGALSKAQKFSKNNYWKHLEKLFFQKKIEFFFEKKYFFRKSHNAEKLKKAIQAH